MHELLYENKALNKEKSFNILHLSQILCLFHFWSELR